MRAYSNTLIWLVQNARLLKYSNLIGWYLNALIWLVQNARLLKYSNLIGRYFTEQLKLPENRIIHFYMTYIILHNLKEILKSDWLKPTCAYSNTLIWLVQNARLLKYSNLIGRYLNALIWLVQNAHLLKYSNLIGGKWSRSFEHLLLLFYLFYCSLCFDEATWSKVVRYIKHNKE